MITNSNSFVLGVPSGNLKVYPDKAVLNPKTLMIGLPKLFCKVRLGKGLQETSVDRKNGLEPFWQQELGFRRTNENQIKIELCDQFVIGPTIIGECFINLDLVFSQRQVAITSQLLKKGTVVGTLHVRLKWEPDNVLPIFQPPTNQFSGNPFLPNSSHPFGSTNSTNSFGTNPFSSNTTNSFSGYNMNNISVSTNANVLYAPPQTNTTTNFYQSGTELYQPNMSQQPMSFSLQQGPVFQPMSLPVDIRAMSAQPMNRSQSSDINSGVQIIQQEEIKEPEESEDPNLPDEQKCVICLDKKKAGAFYRCGHNCCCTSCGRKFIGSPCPICRQVVLDFIKVYDT